tara:strand:+ start:108 stop:968 length:861 start_codon:yes stop_codon:yes gene_type:complete
MKNLINIPDYLYINLDLNNLNNFQKVKLIIKGKLIGLIFKIKSENVFCLLMNLLHGGDGKIYFENNYYIKKTRERKVFYPNRRISNIFIDYKLHIEKFFKTYCLDEINFQENDLVIDCGANIGELYLAFDVKKIKISYIAFEPDKKAFNSLEKNTKNGNQQLYNLALSDKNEKRKLYTDTDGGNTSLSEFESTSIEEIETKTLDSFNFKNIKLLKIDAEGHEPEVLTGLTETLKNVEYIAIDHSDERGFNQEKTTVEVFDFLYKNNFQVVAVSPFREISLFKNSLK